MSLTKSERLAITRKIYNRRGDVTAMHKAYIEEILNVVDEVTDEKPKEKWEEKWEEWSWYFEGGQDLTSIITSSTTNDSELIASQIKRVHAKKIIALHNLAPEILGELRWCREYLLIRRISSGDINNLIKQLEELGVK